MKAIKIWIKNARSVSLAQSLLPAVLAVVIAINEPSFNIIFAILAVLGVVAAHLGMNLADDYFDYKVNTAESRTELNRQGIRARMHKYPYLTSNEASVKDLRNAIILFLLIGLSLFTFANPQEEEKKLDNGKEDKEDQIKIFEAQLDLAEKYNLPVIIHTRDSIQDCYDILKKRKLKGIIHCYSGSVEMAELFIKLGYKLGIGGVVTFKKSIVAEAVAEMALEDIILETDCPYLTPVPYRGRRNESSYVAYVCEKIAEIKGLTPEEVGRITTANARRVFLPNE